MLAIIRIIITLLLVPVSLYGQPVKVQLSPSHIQKLNKTTNATRKLLLYQKYFRADSTIQTKQALAVLENQTDSLLNKIVHVHAIQKIDSLKQISKIYQSVLSDTTLPDSSKITLTNHFRKLASDKLVLNPAFEKLFSQNKSTRDTLSWKSLTRYVPGLDSLQGLFQGDPGVLFSTIENKLSSVLTKNEMIPVWQGGGANTLQNALINPLQQIPHVPVSTSSLRNQLTQKAEESFDEMISTGNTQLAEAQSKISKLINKYRSFTNSEDLKGSVKQTSLQGKCFRERIFLGTDFQVITMTPFSIDVSVKGGYRFNSLAHAGVAVNYRFSSRDSIPSLKPVSPDNTSYRIFGSYEIVQSFFITSEWERSYRVIRLGDQKQIFRGDNFFIGAGKRLLVHPKFYLTITALYNLSKPDDASFYRQRFQVRTGFQLSELATRKKKHHYNPNE